jgi:ABC-2 type transport system permease protein
MKSLKVWLKYTNNSFQQNLFNKYAVTFLLLGKFIRIALFIVFLFYVLNSTKTLAGYTREQVIFFYLSFNLLDTLGQMFFREANRFRDLIITGNLDLVLTKPIHPLVRVLLGGTDPLDFIILIFLIVAIISYGLTFITQNPLNWIGYFFMIIISLMIVTSFYISVLSFGILTTAIDHMLLVYRDFTGMMRIPVDLYIEPIRFIITFIIPLGIMMSFPPKVLMGLLSPLFILLAVLFAVVSLFISLKFWDNSLKYYTSASS